MKRALIVLIPVALVPAAIVVACGVSNDHPPPAPGCANGVNCNSGPGIVSSGSPDTGTTPDGADGAFEVGEAGVTVDAIVRPINSFSGDPTTGTFETTVTIRAPRRGGGTDVEATMPIAADGTYTLTGVDPVVGGITWLQVWKAGIKRTLSGVALPAPDATFSLPLFPENLPFETWNATGQTAVYPTNPGTIVVHVFGKDGKRLAGVTAEPGAGLTTKGPFYDVGTDVGTTAATGAKGTIVFLGITSVPLFPVTLSFGGKTFSALQVPVEANVVSHLPVQLE